MVKSATLWTPCMVWLGVAWDVDDADDLRVKTCISKAGLFPYIHHELGHNFYTAARCARLPD